jgi:hypothetical protein
MLEPAKSLGAGATLDADLTRELLIRRYAARTTRYWLFGEALGRLFTDCFLPGLLSSITLSAN